jgi:hypothetical protein
MMNDIGDSPTIGPADCNFLRYEPWLALGNTNGSNDRSTSKVNSPRHYIPPYRSTPIQAIGSMSQLAESRDLSAEASSGISLAEVIRGAKASRWRLGTFSDSPHTATTAKLPSCALLVYIVLYWKFEMQVILAADLVANPVSSAPNDLGLP